MWQNMGKYGLRGSSMRFHRAWNRDGDGDLGREPGSNDRWHWNVDTLGELAHHSALVGSHGRGLGMGGSQWVCVLNDYSGGCVETRKMMGITESRKTVHLSSICWASSLCQALWQVLRIPNGVQQKQEPSRTHSRGRDMKQCFNSLLWHVWLEEGRRCLTLLRWGRKLQRKWMLNSWKLNSSFTGGQGLQKAFWAEHMVSVHIKKQEEKLQEVQCWGSGYKCEGGGKSGPD